MSEPAKHVQFDLLPPVEQHTAQTWIDELSRRGTLVDTVRAHDDRDVERPSQVYSIPSAESDWRSAEAVLGMR